MTTTNPCLEKGCIKCSQSIKLEDDIVYCKEIHAIIYIDENGVSIPEKTKVIMLSKYANLYYCDELCDSPDCKNCRVQQFWNYLKDSGLINGVKTI